MLASRASAQPLLEASFGVKHKAKQSEQWRHGQWRTGREELDTICTALSDDAAIMDR